MDATPEQSAARLKALVARIDAGESIAREEQDALLSELESYECWAPFRRLIQRTLDDSNQRSVNDYVRLARMQAVRLEDTFGAAQTCVRMIKDLKLDFQTFAQTALPAILEADDFAGEAKILQGVYPVLAAQEDRVGCLEKLCLIYEKKVFDEVLLNKSYEKLLALDPKNLKALRYFKLVFAQSNEWEDVARVLRLMLDNVEHPNDASRIALELATVYLYQIDAPSLAVSFIEEHCPGSDLDTTTVHFEAYNRLGDWEGCIRVLKDSLAKVQTDLMRGIIHFKCAEMEEKLGRMSAAVASYEEAVRAAPKFLEPLERLLEISLAAKNWQTALKYLDVLQGALSDPELAERVREARARLKNGLDHAR